MSVRPQPSAGNPTFGFWRARRPLRAAGDPVSRGRPRRPGASALWGRGPPVELTVKLEVEKFKFYGKLRPTQTDVHNSLPSSQTIRTEKTLMSFQESRRSAPEHTPYDDFYRTLTSSVTPLTTSRTWEDTLRSSRLSSRGPPDTPKTTVFTLFPGPLSGQSGKLCLSNKQSVLARLVTSYGRRPSRSLLDDLRPAGGHSSGKVRMSPRNSSRDGEERGWDSLHSSSAAGREFLSTSALSSREGGDMERPSCAVLGRHREDSRELVSRDSRELVSRDSREMSRGGSESEPNSHRYLDVEENYSSLTSSV